MNCCCCAFRFGWSAIIGIIPVLGAAINLLIAMQVVRKCMEVDLPQFVVSSPLFLVLLSVLRADGNVGSTNVHQRGD